MMKLISQYNSQAPVIPHSSRIQRKMFLVSITAARVLSNQYVPFLVFFDNNAMLKNIKNIEKIFSI